MKKNLYILAVACLALASCSNDETVATRHDPNEISFRPLVNGVTRATATTISSFTTTQGFYVGAWQSDNHNSYFVDTEFKREGETSNYRSDNKYYWPASGSLDFVGFYPNKDNTSGPLKHLAWNTFTFEPSATVSSHADYVIAATLNQAKPVSGGIGLAFKHLGSWIELKVYNSKGNTTDNMKATVTGWKLGYLYNGGVYTISQSTAAGSGLSTTGSWDYTGFVQANATSHKPTEYSETISDITLSNDGAHDENTETVAVGNAMIIVPQATTKITGSSNYGTGNYLTGAFIGVKLSIKDGSNNVLADATGDEMWAIWPVSNDWVDGYKYTYVIDVAQGGYKEKGTSGQPLVKWLDGAEIFFSSVSVTDWATGSATVVNP